MILKKHSLILLPLVVFLLIYSGLSLALTIKDASIKELTKESDLIVRGRITSIEYVWENQALKKINTRVQLDVTEYLKGEGDYKLEIIQMGGKIGDLEDIIIGTPKMNTNEEVILFLVNKNNKYVIHSIALGSFKIAINEKSQTIAYNDLSEVNLVSEYTSLSILAGKAQKVFLLNDLYQKIQSNLK